MEGQDSTAVRHVGSIEVVGAASPLELELGGDGLAERLPDGLEGDPVVDVGEEALDDQPDRRLAARCPATWA